MIPLDQIVSHFDSPWLLLASLSVFGLAVGVLAGLFGVGGGFMITPMLNLAFGLPYNLAVGSSLSFTIGTGVSGASRHARLGNFEPRCMIILTIAAVGGAWLGAMANAAFQAHFGTANYDLFMDGLFIVVLVISAALVGLNASAERTGPSLLQRLPLPPRINLPRAELTGVSAPGIGAVGLLIGLMAGVMGIGGGVLFMPLLVLVVGLTPHQAVGTSLGVMVFSSTTAVIKYGLDDSVSLWVAMALLVGSALGIQLGAWLCQKLHASGLRRWFALLVLAVVAALAVRTVPKLLG